MIRSDASMRFSLSVRGRIFDLEFERNRGNPALHGPPTRCVRFLGKREGRVRTGTIFVRETAVPDERDDIIGRREPLWKCFW